MNAHTPGPWIVCVLHGESDRYTIFSENQLVDELIEDTQCDDMIARAGLNHENFEANARLIAAAPDLLSIAQKIKAHGTISAAWIDELNAAIAKATGAAA